jgi:hypothetical protein
MGEEKFRGRRDPGALTLDLGLGQGWGKRSLEGDQIQEHLDWDRDGEEKLRGKPDPGVLTLDLGLGQGWGKRSLEGDETQER